MEKENFNKMKNKKNKFTTLINSTNLTNSNNYIRNEINAKKYDEYRRLWEKASNLELVTNFPLQLDFELNYSCNFSCENCTWSTESKEGKGKNTWFPFELFKEIIDEAIPKGLKSIRLNYLNEVLMRKDVDKFIKYARDAGILDIYLTTNGSLLTKNMSKKLIKSGLMRLKISLDATTKETFDKIRKGGNFEKILKNIDNFIELKKKMKSMLPTISVNFVKTNINKHELDDFILQWENKVDSIGIQNLIDIMNKTENITKKTFNCNQPFIHLTIRYDGTVLPCCSFFGAEIPIALLKSEYPLSNIDNIGLLDKLYKGKLVMQSIEEIWNGEKMCEYREMHKKGEYWKNKVCKKCIDSSFNVDDTF